MKKLITTVVCSSLMATLTFAQTKLSTDSLLKAAGQAIQAKDQTQLKQNVEALSRSPEKASKVFQFFEANHDAIDAAMGKDYAAGMEQGAIYNEYFLPVEKTDIPLDWVALESLLKEKYGKIGGKTFLQGAFNYSYYKSNWKNVAKYGTLIQEQYPGMIPNFMVNNLAFEFFQKCQDKAVLKIALQWTARVLAEEPKEPQFLDTYANLLHKLGRTKEAIPFEEKALSIGDNNFRKEMAPVLEKMKAGQQTW